ncbi:hypothetical protein DLM75_14755 [Leptospira stimsonii]|uniref:SCO family protein n=1 Tax=Leptospira stimsonii TaxID=2202203 RepID=A0A396Z6B7_9LEPT|nr:hypothetical protein DLM75_14755 [Leptospira stimsonii]
MLAVFFRFFSSKNYRLIFHPFLTKSISVSIIVACLYFVLAENPFVIGDSQSSVSVFKVDREIPKFRIRNEKEDFFTEENLQNGKYLIYFGYGDCRSICRTGISKLNHLLSMREFSSWSLVLVSLDPEKDRVQESWLRKYVSHWEKSPILLLPENREESRKIAKRFQLIVNEEFSGEIFHQNSLYITDTKGKIRVVIPDMSEFSEKTFQTVNVAID